LERFLYYFATSVIISPGNLYYYIDKLSGGSPAAAGDGKVNKNKKY